MSGESMQFNTRSAGVRRLMKEAKELKEPTEMYHAQPYKENLFEWHFTVRGPTDSDFDGGIYHGRMLFPPDYPMKPPNIILLTPNGRFELNKKICLSISGYHPETWLPSWSIRTALLALIGFMPTNGGGAIGSVNYPSTERKKLAISSTKWSCKECGAVMKDELKELSEDGKKEESEARSLINKSSKDVPSTSIDQSNEVTPPVVEPSPLVRLNHSNRNSNISHSGSNNLLIISLLFLCITVFVGLFYRRLYLI